jgi:ribosomal protein S18 acetylase RimI-like enzyme
MASTGDFLSVAALDRLAWPERPDTYIPDGEHIWRVWAEHAALIVARLTDSHRLKASSDIAGAAVMFSTAGNELFLHKIMVHPDCRSQGIGSALLQHAVQRADRPVLLTVDPENVNAVQLYRKFGFTERSHVAGYYRPHEDRLVMEFQPD